MPLGRLRAPGGFVGQLAVCLLDAVDDSNGMLTQPSVGVVDDVADNVEQCRVLHVEPRLFAKLTHEALARCLAEVDASTRQVPEAGSLRLHEKYGVVHGQHAVRAHPLVLHEVLGLPGHAVQPRDGGTLSHSLASSHRALRHDRTFQKVVSQERLTRCLCLDSAVVGLLLLDLDNTLVDRAAAFRRWATQFVLDLGGAATEVDWLIAEDADGYRPREDVGASIAERFGLDTAARSTIVGVLRAGLVEEMTLEPAVAAALQRARSLGWTLIAVTNGTVRQQEHKIRHLGLDGHLDGWVISEGVGVKKPDARIFRVAAELTGLALEGAWMVGDHPTADVFGAQNVGAATCWIRRGRVWSETTYLPTAEADDCASALTCVIERS